MQHRLKLSIVLQGLTLFLLGPACEASSLGMTVHVVPLDSDGGKMVRAHFTAIVPNPCPALTGLCATGEDCLVHTTSLPFSGSKPDNGWCVRQWQKTVASNYTANISLGSDTEFYVSIKAEPKVRANSGRLNQPAFVALPPPLRARVNCPHHFHLSTKDLDGDNVRCRFARPGEGECLSCTQHSFIELDEEKCMVTFTGNAPVGQYFIYLMAEDLVPIPKISHVTDNQPLSSVPVHLSLTVEESTSSCSDEPVATGDTPKEDSTLYVLPYQEVNFNVNFLSELESVIEAAVVGPPELHRTGLKTIGPLAIMTMAWVRSENNLARLLPICFVVNTESMQSEPRCVWLNQREMMTLPAGTELTCEKTEMTLVLPVSSLTNINLDELQLNSPTCPVTYNDTHLTARISLDGCGTKIVVWLQVQKSTLLTTPKVKQSGKFKLEKQHSGSELVYTNTLQSVRTYTVVSRKPSLILPLACRIPGVQAKGPQYKINMPTEKEAFGEVAIWIEIYLTGKGPLSKFTRNPELRALRHLPLRKRRDAETSSGSNTTSSIPNSTTPIISNYTTPTISSNTTSSISTSTSVSTSPAITTSSIPNSTTSIISNYTTPTISSNTTSGISTSTSVSTSPAMGSKIDKLDLYVMSNCSIDRAEMMVSNCIKSETEDFADSEPILLQGCTASEGTFEIITTQNNSKIYRIDLNTLKINGTTMYIRCSVNLCIATMPSQKCPSMCTRSINQRATVGNLYTKTYTIDSGPISTVITTPAPAVTIVATTTTPNTATSSDSTISQSTTGSHAPPQASAMAAVVVFTTISMFLQTVFLHQTHC